jgi:hypothetical protein
VAREAALVMHLDGGWAHVAAAMLAALEHRRGDRRPVAVVVGELVIASDVTLTWVLEHGLATRLALAPSTVLRELARVLEVAAAEPGDLQ